MLFDGKSNGPHWMSRILNVFHMSINTERDIMDIFEVLAEHSKPKQFQKIDIIQ